MLSAITVQQQLFVAQLLMPLPEQVMMSSPTALSHKTMICSGLYRHRTQSFLSCWKPVCGVGRTDPSWECLLFLPPFNSFFPTMVVHFNVLHVICTLYFLTVSNMYLTFHLSACSYVHKQCPTLEILFCN